MVRLCQFIRADYTHSDVGDLEVIQDEGIAVGTDAKSLVGEIKGQAHLLGPFGVGISNRNDLWCV